MLIAIFSAGIVILFAQGMVALRSVETAAGLMGDGKDIVSDILPPPLYLIEAQLVANEVMQAPASNRREVAERFRQLRRDFDERNAYWRARSSALDHAVVATLFGRQREKADLYWLALEKRFLPAAFAGDETQARRALDELKVIYAEHRSGVDETVKAASAWSEARKAELAATVRQSNLVFAIVALASIAVGVLVALLTVRAIVIPLAELQRTITDVEKSADFTLSMKVVRHDEVGVTAHSFNQLLSTLRAAFRSIQGSALEVSDAALRLSASSRQVAASSSLQSESTSAMAATVEEVTVSINHISSNAREAESASRLSGKLSLEGGDVIRNAAAEMTHIATTVREISSSIDHLTAQSSQISAVVQVIKEVADQTNLLALNAAIEAARAGEQGRGFAVVADEVRKLAERTRNATEEIATMIGNIQASSTSVVTAMSVAVDQARGSLALAEEAGNAIKEIETGADHVIALVDDISSSLSEQSAASNDIASHVERVARMIQENNGAASLTAEAAVQLERLASQMRQVVERFRI
jgi:methyl-accepting chemotaxis protein